MRQKPAGRPPSSEQIIRDIKRKTRKQYSAEEKIRIVLDGLRGEDSIAELCRRGGQCGGAAQHEGTPVQLILVLPSHFLRAC